MGPRRDAPSEGVNLVPKHMNCEFKTRNIALQMINVVLTRMDRVLKNDEICPKGSDVFRQLSDKLEAKCKNVRTVRMKPTRF